MAQLDLFQKITLNVNDSYVSVGSVKQYKVFRCHRKEICNFIEYWHYSKNANGLTTDYCFKIVDCNYNIIGAIMYGKISMANVWKKYAEKENDLIELKRLCCIDNTPKNTESFFIGHTLRWLKKNTNIKRVISYADMTHNHKGVIYKASNFKYSGMTSKGKVILYKNKIYHDKAIRNTYNGKLKPFSIEIKKALDIGNAKYIETEGKHIYLYDIK